METILASTSPRRRMILSALIPRMSIVPPDADESVREDESPLEYCTRAAREKAASIIRAGRGGDSLIIAADTIVTIDGMILGKPDDREHAFRTLSLLNGRTHRVVTALCLSPPGGAPLAEGIESTDVTFRMLSGEGIDRYLDAIEYHDKAGSYAFQDQGSLIIDRYSGSTTNIIGFPLRLFFSMVSALGVAEELFMSSLAPLKKIN